jgi:hypothetical protein
LKKLIFVLAYLLLAVPCGARTITVDDDGQADFNNIQAAINTAVNGDIIIVSPGTYISPGNRDIDFLGKPITVRSTDPNDPNIVAATFIDCQNSGRGFYFHNSEDANSIVTGFTITNGRAAVGGGIYCLNSSPMLTNCSFINNLASDRGGGMYNKYNVPTIINCIFIGNNAGSLGGGMFNDSSRSTLTNCTFSDNSSNYGGGGMCNAYLSRPTVTNCLFISNSAAVRGGGMYNYLSNPTVINCTLSSNSATRGGGMCNYYISSPMLTNCILWSNTASTGAQIYNNDMISSPAVTFSDVQGGWTGKGNINADPCFIEPGYWVDANDPNIIVEPNDPNAVWLDGDYRLLFNSPCIDTGDPNYVPKPNETDLDGNPRVFDGDRDGAAVVDMGAYEYLNTPPVAVAGPNQTVYAWINGLADVALVGSASYDDDNDMLDYYWSWTIDGNTYEANSINPTIELPVGNHTIELVVDDGIDLSEPDYCTITVIRAVRGRLMLSPNVLQTKSRGKWILATLFMPPVPGEKVNTTVPLRLYPSGIEAKYQRFYRFGRFGCAPTFAIAFFDKQMVSDAFGPGRFEVSVVGQFLSGRLLFGSDTIKILSPPLKPPHHRH